VSSLIFKSRPTAWT